MDKRIGHFVYGTFGLRKEWIFQFLNKGYEFWENNDLGPKQRDAFVYYLKHSELINNKDKSLTKLFFILRDILVSEGINSLTLWGVLWVNLCFNSLLFRFWLSLNPGKYSRNDLLQMMIREYGKNNRTVINGLLSLIGTFERTPIGVDLKQGIVIKEGRSRVVIKEGNVTVPSIVFLYSLYKFAEFEGKKNFSLVDIQNSWLSPQRIFSVDTERLYISISRYIYYGLLDLNSDLIIKNLSLKEDLKSIEILEKYKKGEIS